MPRDCDAVDTPAELLVLALEGPDSYALAGGLGVRVSGLVSAAARLGVQTHLIFIGDPLAPAEEVREGGFLTLHRWGQWISRHHPGGVYDGEWGKVADYIASVPPYAARLAREAIAAGRSMMILAEEWQTAEALCRTIDLLRRDGCADRCTFVWNCNHPVCLDNVDWRRLRDRAVVTTVSEYMRMRLQTVGVQARVVPNGIPASLLAAPPEQDLRRARAAFRGRVSLVKVGRWDPDKGWLQAVEAAALVRRRGLPVRLLMRGGVEPHGGDVLRRCRDLGLAVADVPLRDGDAGEADALIPSVADRVDADVLNLRFQLTDQHKRVLFRACDAVLANSLMEPFGLVGLEAMAAGGVAVVGRTGEDYASDSNALRLRTGSAEELAESIWSLMKTPETSARLRIAGRHTAREFVWEHVLSTGLWQSSLRAQMSRRRPAGPIGAGRP